MKHWGHEVLWVLNYGSRWMWASQSGCYLRECSQYTGFFVS